MSRIGNNPVTLVKGVKVDVDGSILKVQGPKGSLEQAFQPEVSFELNENEILVKRINDSKRAKSMHGLYRNLLNNMIIGVSEGFNKVLIINGVGYRAEIKGKILHMNLGFSNPVEYEVPEDVTIVCETQNKVIVSGIDKQVVGQVSAEIRSIRGPEPYKGKGIKYETETIRRKVGKSGVK